MRLASLGPVADPAEQHDKASDKSGRKSQPGKGENYILAHSRNLPRDARPSKCKAPPIAKQPSPIAIMSRTSIETGANWYNSAAIGAKTPAATDAVANVFSHVAVSLICSL